MTDSTASGAAPGTAAPGWYPDGSGGRRWWDGRAWTPHTAPGAAAAPLERPALPEGAPIDTGWVWVVATVPWLAAIPVFFFDFAGYMRGIIDRDIGPAVASLLVYSLAITITSWGAYAFAIVAAYRDHRHLVAIGVVRPFHWAFTFISSLVYLIGRHVILRQVSRTPGWPMWVQIGFFVLYLIAIFVWMAILMQQVFAMVPFEQSGGFR